MSNRLHVKLQGSSFVIFMLNSNLAHTPSLIYTHIFKSSYLHQFTITLSRHYALSYYIFIKSSSIKSFVQIIISHDRTFSHNQEFTFPAHQRLLERAFSPVFHITYKQQLYLLIKALGKSTLAKLMPKPYA